MENNLFERISFATRVQMNRFRQEAIHQFVEGGDVVERVGKRIDTSKEATTELVQRIGEIAAKHPTGAEEDPILGHAILSRTILDVDRNTLSIGTEEQVRESISHNQTSRISE